jgi:hypothetical protein
MSQLVFLGQSGGSVTLTNADTATAKNLTVPAVDGTLLYIDSNGTLTVPNLTVTGLPLFTGTTALGLPVGTGTQRPVNPTVGEIRYCTDAGGFFEGYEAGNWRKFTTTALGLYSITYLIVAGGAGGAGNQGGGGGAGGVLSGSASLTPSNVYTITVGAGGAAVTAGSNSSAVGVTTVGGGFGATTTAGGDGGSGGGGGIPFNVSRSGGLGTAGQGNNGGAGASDNVTYSCGGGGGGANTVGGSGAGASGGSGVSSSIEGFAVVYGGGGGGGSNVSPGTGGSGGGGAGGSSNGTAGTGGLGGGGGGGGGGAFVGGAGGSGVVILSILTTNYTGTVSGSPTVTTNGSYTVVKYTNSGTYTA